ncbi:ATP-binding protein [Rhodopirellula sp. JC639]|uniref:ATP-binding protein n=1 Tax=Stieleria mannarensis TaxID=2755585 RepID=UPI001602143A|nr:ATP-binding protein [Rhodopirellula sp. JC639]
MAAGNAIDCDTRFHPNHELAAQVLDSLTAEVAVVNTTGAILATNQAWEDFAVQNGGCPSLTGVGANYFDVCRSARGDELYYAEQAYQGISDVLAGKRHVFTLEYPCHCATEKRWFLLHVSPLKGDASKAVTAHVSITDRKIIEHQLVETTRLAAIGDAMQGLSHKGRNSLQQAQGFIDLLRYWIADDADARKLLDRIELAQQRLVCLYEEVLHYAEPMHLNCSVGRLDDVVEEAWASVLPVDDQLTLQHPTQGMDLSCEMDRDAIWQVMKILFDNAAETGSKTTRIDVSYQTGVLNHRPAITMVVSDNGPGIAAADHERVFEPFFTTKTIGTGLGLARARRIVELHGGQMQLGASVLGGASFYLTLPRQPIAR